MTKLTLIGLALAAVGLAGCEPMMVHWHRNALGNVNVEKPPKATLPVGQTERAGDPGERDIVVAAGGWAAVAVDGHGHRHGQLGIEAEFFFASLDRSHYADDFFTYPFEAMGFIAGWQLYDNGGDNGAIYLEAAGPILPSFFRPAAGVAWDVDDHLVGPQLTLSALGIYVRVQSLFGADDKRFFLQFGFAFEPPLALTWSR